MLNIYIVVVYLISSSYYFMHRRTTNMHKLIYNAPRNLFTIKKLLSRFSTSNVFIMKFSQLSLWVFFLLENQKLCKIFTNFKGSSRTSLLSLSVKKVFVMKFFHFICDTAAYVRRKWYATIENNTTAMTKTFLCIKNCSLNKKVLYYKTKKFIHIKMCGMH